MQQMSWFYLVYDRQLQGLWNSLTSNREKCNSHQRHAQAGNPHDLFIKPLQNLLPCDSQVVKSEGAEYVYSHYHCSCRTLLYFTCSSNLFMEVPIFLDICSRSLLNGPRLLQYNLYA